VPWLNFDDNVFSNGLASFFSIATAGPEEATLSAIVFAGEILGTAVFGPLADIVGRRKPSIV
jgi:MFS family permease